MYNLHVFFGPPRAPGLFRSTSWGAFSASTSQDLVEESKTGGTGGGGEAGGAGRLETWGCPVSPGVAGVFRLFGFFSFFPVLLLVSFLFLLFFFFLLLFLFWRRVPIPLNSSNQKGMAFRSHDHADLSGCSIHQVSELSVP